MEETCCTRKSHIHPLLLRSSQNVNYKMNSLEYKTFVFGIFFQLLNSISLNNTILNREKFSAHCNWKCRFLTFRLSNIQ